MIEIELAGTEDELQLSATGCLAGKFSKPLSTGPGLAGELQ